MLSGNRLFFGLVSGPNSSMAPHRLLIVGHSIARDVQQYTHNHNIDNFNLNHNQINVAFCAQGGIVTDNLLNGENNVGRKAWFAGQVSRTIRRFRPETVLLQIGDNDMLSGSAQDIAQNIVSTAHRMRTLFPFIRKVGISKLLPRYGSATNIRRVVIGRGFVVEDYNEKSNEINLLIAIHTARDNALFWWDHKLQFPADDENAKRYNENAVHFRRDGVHLTDSGLKKLYLAMRHIAIRQSRQ